jgi:hypothetical protein
VSNQPNRPRVASSAGRARTLAERVRDIHDEPTRALPAPPVESVYDEDSEATRLRGPVAPQAAAAAASAKKCESGVRLAQHRDPSLFARPGTSSFTRTRLFPPELLPKNGSLAIDIQIDCDAELAFDVDLSELGTLRYAPRADARTAPMRVPFPAGPRVNTIPPALDPAGRPPARPSAVPTVRRAAERHFLARPAGAALAVLAFVAGIAAREVVRSAPELAAAVRQVRGPSR